MNSPYYRVVNVTFQFRLLTLYNQKDFLHTYIVYVLRLQPVPLYIYLTHLLFYAAPAVETSTCHIALNKILCFNQNQTTVSELIKNKLNIKSSLLKCACIYVPLAQVCSCGQDICCQNEGNPSWGSIAVKTCGYSGFDGVDVNEVCVCFVCMLVFVA